MLVLYNAIMSTSTGVGLLLLVWLGVKVRQRALISPEGWSLSFAVPGVILTILGFVMSITWPYRVAGAIDANILMGPPSIAFGLLLLAASVYMWKRRAIFVQLGSDTKSEADAAYDEIVRVVAPVSLFVFSVGLIMVACAVAWVRYQLGAAPPSEPISGRVGGHKVIESTFMGVLYALVAVGALLFPWSLRPGKKPVQQIIAICWIIAGIVFVIFGAFNFYTHIGDAVNSVGGHYRW